MLFVLVLFASIYSKAQYLGKIMVYTTEKDASFIAYINGEKQNFIPTDTFEIELPNVKNVELLIDFVDSNVYDIQKNLDFSQFKYRKFRIVRKKNNFWSKLKSKTGSDEVRINNSGKELIDKFTLKDQSLKSYIKDIND